MPKRKQSPENLERKDSSKVTKQEPTRKSERLLAKPPLPKPEAKAKKVVIKQKAADEKGAKTRKGTTKGKKEDGPAQNGDAKANKILVCRPSVSVSSIRNSAPSTVSVRGQTETVRVKGN